MYVLRTICHGCKDEITVPSIVPMRWPVEADPNTDVQVACLACGYRGKVKFSECEFKENWIGGQKTAHSQTAPLG
jgi:RNase P subunit RPR2